MEMILANPAVVLFLIGGAITAGIWLIRLEGRINATITDKEKYRETLREKLKEIEDDLKDTRTRFFEHAANAAVHHNAEAYSEFKVALERRMMGMETSLKDIGLKLDKRRSHQ